MRLTGLNEMCEVKDCRQEDSIIVIFLGLQLVGQEKDPLHLTVAAGLVDCSHLKTLHVSMIEISFAVYNKIS